MKYNHVEIEEVNCECADMRICRVILTAISENIALHQATYLSGFGIITAAPVQVCIEGLLPASKTPDGRPGVIIHINVPAAVSHERFRRAVFERLFILPHLPTCSLFDAAPGKKEASIDIGKHIRRWGDGFETKEKLEGRDIFRLPIMTGDMLVESRISIIQGVDAALEVFAGNAASCLMGAQEAVCRIFRDAPGAAVFNFPIGGISGAKVGGINYTEERVTINEPYCPTLKNRVKKSRLPEGAGAVIEFPIIGLDKKSIGLGLKLAIDAFASTPGVMRITCPSFGGSWGKQKIYLPKVVCQDQAD